MSISLMQPIVTAEKYLEYKRKNGHLTTFAVPKIVLICYQKSSLSYLLSHIPSTKCDTFSDLYLTDDDQIGILGDFGIGAPALAIKMEQLIALGVTKFIAAGTAGALMNQHAVGDFIIAQKALAEDGVAHLYLEDKSYVLATQEMLTRWNAFIKDRMLPEFQEAATWSFSAIFKETPTNIARVVKQGYSVVEMEAATFYAISLEKGVQALSLFVISDSITQESWTPHLKEPFVKDHSGKLALWALQFCKEMAGVK